MDFRSVTEQLLFSTVRLETTGPHGAGAGTAFGFSYQRGDASYLFLVTNKHVIANATTGTFFFTQAEDAKPLIGQRLDIEVTNFEAEWHGHPSPEIDIAVMPLEPVLRTIRQAGKHVFFRPIHHTFMPTPDQLSKLDAVEEIIFIGYPNGIFDAQNLTPIARRGTTATHPFLDYGGDPVFLIDASVFPGSSGSPVITYTPSNAGGVRLFAEAPRLLFLGVVAQVLIKHDYGQLDFVPIPTGQAPLIRTTQMIDLGVVFKSYTVLDTVLDFLQRQNRL